MRLPIVFHRQARAEFDADADWYERRRPGPGGRFLSAIRHVLEQAATNPERYATVLDDVREGVVHGFPYCVYYRQEPSRIVVFAVFHTSRDPAVWQSRT